MTLVKVKQVSEITGLSESHLNKLRVYDPENSPPFVRIGRSVRYPVEQIDEWVRARIVGGKKST